MIVASFAWWIVLFVLGLVVGSFLNVVSLRFKPEERFSNVKRIMGRSMCLLCGKQLKWYELFPLLSFVLQKGKCRSCLGQLSWQYPVVELITGLLFVAVPLFVKSYLFTSGLIVAPLGVVIGASVFWIVVFLTLVLVFLVDMKHYIIPNSLNVFLIILGILWIVGGIQYGIFSNQITHGSFVGHFADLVVAPQSALWSHLLGMGVGTVFFFLIVALSLGRAMGMGDVKLMIGLGLLFGWPDIILVMFFSFVIGAVYSLALLMRNQKKFSDKVPFGPFIVIASFLTFFWGTQFLEFYFNLIG